MNHRARRPTAAPRRRPAVGDLHGDMPKALRCLKLAGVIDVVNDEAVWTGGNTVVVQLGDVLDRGDAEIGEGPPALLQAALHTRSTAVEVHMCRTGCGSNSRAHRPCSDGSLVTCCEQDPSC